MDIILLFFAITGIFGIRIVGKNQWHHSYMSYDQTRAVSGAFVLLVFMAHVSSYMQLGPGDQIYRFIRRGFSQLIVAPFFFYSGYGICRSCIEKGKQYIKQMPYRRILRVWYHFAIAVCFYWLLLKMYGYRINPTKLPLVFLGWYSIGNSNWFIFDILVFYLISFCSFSVFSKHISRAVWCNLGLCIVFGIALSIRLPDQKYIYNLLLTYPVGVLFGYYQEPIENWIKQSKRYLLILFLSLICFVVLAMLRRNIIAYEMHGLVFLWLLVLVTVKVQLGNRFLDFLGSHIFEIYIYQRIPMIILHRLGCSERHVMFAILCFAATIVIAWLMKIVEDHIDRILYRQG